MHDERTQTVASDPLRLELWRKLNGDIRQIPRCRVILCMDANGEVYTTLPWIGNAGTPLRDRRQRWTQNGHELLELLRSNQFVAISTCAEAHRQCWTWLSPFGTRRRLDYMTTRQTDADHGKVNVDYRMPVGLSGFRDHRPLFARVCTRARWKRRQPAEEKHSDGTVHCWRERVSTSAGLEMHSLDRGHRLQFGRTTVSSTPSSASLQRRRPPSHSAPENWITDLGPCWGGDALVTTFGAEPLSLDLVPQLS